MSASARSDSPAKCVKSKRRRSGATSEPACFTCVPDDLAQRRVQRGASRCGCAGSRSRRADVDLGPRRAPRRRARRTRSRTRWTIEPADRPLHVRARPLGPRPVDDAPGVPDLAAGLGVERRGRRARARLPDPRPARSTGRPVQQQRHDRRTPSSRGRSRSRRTRVRVPRGQLAAAPPASAPSRRPSTTPALARAAAPSRPRSRPRRVDARAPRRCPAPGRAGSRTCRTGGTAPRPAGASADRAGAGSRPSELLEQLEPGGERLGEALLLAPPDLEDRLARRHAARGRPRPSVVDHDRRHLVQERLRRCPSLRPWRIARRSSRRST